MLTPAEVEEAIEAIMKELESLTEDYRKIAREAADAEADYRLRYYSTLVRLKQDGIDGQKVTAAVAEAQATIRAAEELRRYKVTGATLDSAKQALLTYRTRLDALRTLAASNRVLTT